MQRHVTRRLPAAFAAVAALLVTAAVAIGATGTTPTAIALVLHGGTQTQKALCNDPLHSYQGYKVGATLQMDGYLTPQPSGTWHGKFKVEKCKLGKWVDVWFKDEPGYSGTYLSQPAGHFQGTYKPLATGLYRLKAEYTPTGATQALLITEYQHFNIHR